MLKIISEVRLAIGIILLGVLCIWNLYTIIVYGYVTNGVWVTYYEEEPDVFWWDAFEIFSPILIPLLILVVFKLYFYIRPYNYSFARNINVPNKNTKAKRLRRKKRKKKRTN